MLKNTILIFVLLLASCSKEQPKIPEAFRGELNQFISEGIKLETMLESGTNRKDFAEQVITAKTSYKLLKDTWPPQLSNDSQTSFEDAFRGWKLGLQLWEDEINEYAYPYEYGNKQYFADFDLYEQYGEGDLKILEGADCDEGKRCLPHDPNVQILLSKGNANFLVGKTKVLALLE